MNNAHELLDTLVQEEGALYIARPDTEEHIVVGEDRYITVPEALKRIAVQFDHDIETVTFDCPRYWDNVDMSTMKIYINYMRPDAVIGSYLAQNVTIDEVDDTIMHFDWTISQNVTTAKGQLIFLVCVKNATEEGVLENHWNSERNTDMYISEGLDTGDPILEEYPDIVTQLLVRMDGIEETCRGVGISKIELSGSTDTSNIYTIWLTDGTSYPIEAKTGPQGPQGLQGPQGPQGPQGIPGPQGPQGKSGVYVGSGECPEGYNVQIDTDEKEPFILPEVLQSTGDSEEDTMSQKAITEELKNLTSPGYISTNNSIVLDNVKNGTYFVKFETWEGVIEDYDAVEISVTDTEKEYNAYVPANCAPVGTKRLGVYDAEGNKVGTIRALAVDKLGEPLYSFGVIADVNILSYPTTIYLEQALTYFNSVVDFVCICGDLSESGSESQLIYYKSTVDTNATIPVYAITGNADANASSKISTYTNRPLCYTIFKGSDVFIMCGTNGYERGSLFEQSDLQWLYNTLEANRNKRCFLFIHAKPGSDIWGGSEAIMLESLLKHYPNIIFFNAYSHELFELQETSVDVHANYKHIFGCHSVHVPSVTDDSQGYIVDVYDKCVVLKGKNFNGSFLPIATYYLNTAIKYINGGGYSDHTNTITVNDKAAKYTNLLPLAMSDDGGIYGVGGMVNWGNITLDTVTGELVSTDVSDRRTVTGFIPVSYLDRIYLSGFIVGEAGSRDNVYFYDANMEFIGYASFDNSALECQFSNEYALSTFVVNNTDTVTVQGRVAYIRITARETTTTGTPIVTVNESIE